MHGCQGFIFSRPDGSHRGPESRPSRTKGQEFLHHICLAAATALHHDQMQQRLSLNDQSDSAMTQDFAFAWIGGGAPVSSPERRP